MASNLIAGIATLAVAGVVQQLAGPAVYSPATVKREAMIGPDGFHGWKETPVLPYAKVSIRDAGDMTVADFNAMRNITLTLNLANGKTVVGRNMGTTETVEVDTDEAKFELRFEGPQLSEQTVTVN
jgi:Phage tail tube protein